MLSVWIKSHSSNHLSALNQTLAQNKEIKSKKAKNLRHLILIRSLQDVDQGLNRITFSHEFLNPVLLFGWPIQKLAQLLFRISVSRKDCVLEHQIIENWNHLGGPFSCWPAWAKRQLKSPKVLSSRSRDYQAPVVDPLWPEYTKLRGSITVPPTSCLFHLDSAALHTLN